VIELTVTDARALVKSIVERWDDFPYDYIRDHRFAFLGDLLLIERIRDQFEKLGEPVDDITHYLTDMAQFRASALEEDKP
jgi:hypothetical protein